MIRIEAAKLLSVLAHDNKAKSIIIQFLVKQEDRYSGVPGEDVRIYAMDALSEIGDIKKLDVLKSYLKESRRERIVAAGTIMKILMRSKEAK